MAKFNSGLLIVLLLIGFLVFAYAGTKHDSESPKGWSLNDLIPTNATGKSAFVFGGTIALLAVTFGLASFISGLFPGKPVPWETLTSNTGWPKYR